MILIFVGVYALASLITGLEARTTEIIASNNNHGRIVGGLPASDGQWPWQVAIHKSRSNNNYDFVCGGILIGKNWVLSAAHCFEEPDITGLSLIFGVYDLQNPSDNSQSRYADSFTNHPDYNPGTFFADISLLRFSESLPFNDYVRPVDLPSDFTPVVVGQRCVASGFGETRGTGERFSILRYAELEIVPLSTCNAWYSDIPLRVTDDHICAGYEEGGVDTCQGDSGGPLVCPASPNSSLYVVQGITSWGYGCAIQRRPGAYTSVLSYINWIVNHTNSEIGSRIPLTGPPDAAITKHRRGNMLSMFSISIFLTHFHGVFV